MSIPKQRKDESHGGGVVGALLVACVAVPLATACDNGRRRAPSPGPSSPTRGCTPGEQRSCACPGGLLGVQICESDGSGFGACVACSGLPTITDAGASSGGAGGLSWACYDTAVGGARTCQCLVDTSNSARCGSYSCCAKTTSLVNGKPSIGCACSTVWEDCEGTIVGLRTTYHEVVRVSTCPP